MFASNTSNEKSMLKRVHKSIGPLDVDFDATLQAFTGEAGIYCDGISDQIARQYAVSFTLMLENRAREIAVEEPRNPGMFEPNRNLVRLALKSIYERHFGTSTRRNLKADIHALPASS
jgi:hypothetical protein